MTKPLVQTPKGPAGSKSLPTVDVIRCTELSQARGMAVPVVEISKKLAEPGVIVTWATPGVENSRAAIAANHLVTMSRLPVEGVNRLAPEAFRQRGRGTANNLEFASRDRRLPGRGSGEQRLGLAHELKGVLIAS
jgi:hypothetical protein